MKLFQCWLSIPTGGVTECTGHFWVRGETLEQCKEKLIRLIGENLRITEVPTNQENALLFLQKHHNIETKIFQVISGGFTKSPFFLQKFYSLKTTNYLLIRKVPLQHVVGYGQGG